MLLSRTNINPRCHLDSRVSPCACQDTIISPATDVCLHVAEYSVRFPAHLTAPSVVHLTSCFSSGSQHPGLSVEAFLPLYPLQRFSVWNCYEYYHRIHRMSRAFSSEMIFFSRCSNQPNVLQLKTYHSKHMIRDGLFTKNNRTMSHFLQPMSLIAEPTSH